jgi:hypothetical protein
MMNGYVKREYNRLRAKNWRASEALRAARVRDRFEDLENEGLVKIESFPEEEPYDDSYIDTWGLSPSRLKKAKEDIARLIERDGCWCYVSFFRPDDESEWVRLDSIGMIEGDIRDTGYDVDLMEAALMAFDAEAGLREKYCS